MNDALKDRLRFYQELGIDEFYRRGAASVVPPAPAPALTSGSPHSEEMAAPAAMAAARRPAPPPAVLPAAPKAADVVLPAMTQAGRGSSHSTETLEQIKAEIGPACDRCKLARLGRHTVVFGSGNPRAEVVFVGEGPGADEDEQGLPFVGRAGQLLTEMIDKSAERMKVPLRREQCYICNVVKCRPPGNRAPEKDEVEACSPFLLRQLDAIHPKAIVALGATAAHTLLGRTEAMGRLRGHWYNFRGSRLMVTYHPAYLLRDPNKKREAWEDMQMLFRFLYSLE